MLQTGRRAGTSTAMDHCRLRFGATYQPLPARGIQAFGSAAPETGRHPLADSEGRKLVRTGRAAATLSERNLAPDGQNHRGIETRIFADAAHRITDDPARPDPIVPCHVHVPVYP